MHPLQSRIGDPKIQVRKDGVSIRLEMSPLPTGFGQTLGNAFRRVLLSSIPGAAITAAKIDGLPHEYETIAGIAESGVEILLNLKDVRITKSAPESVTMKLEAKGKTVVTAGDFQKVGGIEIMNPDLVIANLVDPKASLKMEVTVETGTGYSLAGERKVPGPGWLAVNAIFSPIQKCAFTVETTRSGAETELDKLVVTAETDGTTGADEAFGFAGNLLRYYFGLIDRASGETVDKAVSMTNITGSPSIPSGTIIETETRRFTPIETLQLSPRTLNALINGGIETVERLMQMSKKQLVGLKGFGKKAMDELIDSLESRGYHLSER